MKAHELKKAKRDVRRTILARRDGLAPEIREALAARIHSRFLALPEVVAAGTVLLFWSFGSEVPTESLLAALHERGARMLLPRIVAGDLELRTYAPGDPLAGTSFGAREPTEGLVVSPGEVDVICTPSVAFDRSGRRIGYGGGYYDRLFPAAPAAARVGVAFGVQVVDGDLPEGHFDLRVDAVVTEDETLRWPR